MIFLYLRRRNRSMSSRLGGSSSTTRIGCSASSVAIGVIVSLPDEAGGAETLFRRGRLERARLRQDVGRSPRPPRREHRGMAAALGVLPGGQDEPPPLPLPPPLPF